VAYETEMATWGAVLGGANLIYHAAGWLEGGLTASYEKLVLNVEILQNMMSFLEPIPFDDDDLGFDAIKAVPAGGHFFGSDHTISRYETAFYQPMLSNWQNYGSWQEAGGRDALDRATGIWQQALREYEQPEMDPAIREELDAYIARRKEEIGSGEP
jgi:trimethylamine--corrinoid protein Co-methyltransferase